MLGAFSNMYYERQHRLTNDKLMVNFVVTVKKAVSILLLLVFLFNVGGYYIVFWALRHQANVKLTARLDADLYSEDETIEIKIPMSLPYPLQEGEFKRTNGMFEHHGEIYKLVKHKLQNDTLIVVCIKDRAQKQLNRTMTDYVSLSNDLPGTAKKALNVLGKILKDYNTHHDPALIEFAPWSQDLGFNEMSVSLVTTIISVQSPPPKA
jgi:hypothetical protein